MKSTINKIYYGELCPCEEPPPSTEKYKYNRKTINVTADKLYEKYPDCKDLLDTYTDALYAEAQLESEADFVRGFRLGASIILELFMTD